MALKLPKPPNATASSPLILMISESGKSELPPILTPFMRISSALKSVFLIITLTPLDKVNIVVPKMSSFFSETILPPFGASFIRGSSDTLSIYGVSFSDFTSFNRFLMASSVGRLKPSFSGPNSATTWLLSVTSCCIIWFRAVTGMAGAI